LNRFEQDLIGALIRCNVSFAQLKHLNQNNPSMKNRIKISSVVALFALVACLTSAFGQDDKSKRPSPPAVASKKAGAVTITINYSQPSVKGRKIFGGLEPYGKVWRAGANENTTIEFDRDVKIDGKPLAAGKYGFFAIPNEKEWTLIFNKASDQWGAFSYDEKQDALRITAKPAKTPALTEKLLYTIDPNGTVTLAWENTQVSFQVK
jgi:hypothetical protein